MPRSSSKSTSSTTSSASSTPPTLTSLQHRRQSFEQYVQTPAATTNIVDTLRTCPKTSKRRNNRPTNSINSGWPCWTPLLRSNAAAHVFIVTCTVGEPKSNRYAHHGRSSHRVRHITHLNGRSCGHVSSNVSTRAEAVGGVCGCVLVPAHVVYGFALQETNRTKEPSDAT